MNFIAVLHFRFILSCSNMQANVQRQSTIVVKIMEQSTKIKFCLKLVKSANETRKILQEVYGDDELSRSRFLELFRRFRKARKVSNMLSALGEL